MTENFEITSRKEGNYLSGKGEFDGAWVTLKAKKFKQPELASYSKALKVVDSYGNYEKVNEWIYQFIQN